MLVEARQKALAKAAAATNRADASDRRLAGTLDLVRSVIDILAQVLPEPSRGSANASNAASASKDMDDALATGVAAVAAARRVAAAASSLQLSANEAQDRLCALEVRGGRGARGLCGSPLPLLRCCTASDVARAARPASGD